MKALFIVKPDGVSYLPEIFNILRDNQVEVLAIKSAQVTQDQARRLYGEHQGKFFYETLIKYIQSGAAILLAVNSLTSEKLMVAKSDIRKMIRSIANEKVNDELESHFDALDLRSSGHDLQDNDFKVEFKNEYLATLDGIHCSDEKDAEKEIAIFFASSELILKPYGSRERVDLIAHKLQDKKGESSSLRSSSIFSR